MKATIPNLRAAVERAKLGRPILRSKAGNGHDWAAVDAIKAAAREAGLTEPLCQWVRRATSLTDLASAFLERYSQAYGLGATTEPVLALASHGIRV